MGTTDPELPPFVPPMLAKLGEPFDADDWLFELKWDGMRTLAFVDRDGLRMFNRQRVALVDRYPELGFLADLPRGAVLDGELVVTREGRPDFHLVMTRQHARSPARIRSLAQSLPVTYVVFDLLYDGFESLLHRPLTERRERLTALVAGCPAEKLVMSEGVVGQGRALFEQASQEELEGIVGKRHNSHYLPGKRSDAWVKIKRRVHVHCAILGYVPDGDDDLKSLIIGLEEEGTLRCVGLVGSGIGIDLRAELNELLRQNPRSTPLIPCEPTGNWVEPGLYCTVSYNERTPQGNLRAPVFEALLPT